MRYFPYILIIWLGIFISTADASEVLLGTVVAIDRDQGRITLKLIDTSGGSEGRATSGSIVITLAPNKIPGSVSPGDTIRVWGDYASGGGAKFRADAVRKSGSGGGGTDPTGVRSRLGQGGQGNGQGAGGRGSGKR
jgi:hypothetical protein